MAKRGSATSDQRRQIERDVARIARDPKDASAIAPARTPRAPIGKTALFHGAANPLPVGSTLQARTNTGWFPAPIESALERGRPSHLPSRLSSFFLVDDPTLIRAAGGPTDYVYRVTPVGTCSKHHHGWMGNVYDAMIPFIRHRAPQEEKDAATPKLMHLEEWIRNYWNGVPYRHRPGQAETTWEFLAPAIIVDELL